MKDRAAQPGFFAGLARSRGVRKFRRNRWAMVAMAFITLYFAVALWIGAMEAMQWIGGKTGAYDLTDNRVLGAMLPGRIRERVGPPNLPGFGLAQEDRYRSNQYDLLLVIADQALEAVARVGPDDPRTPRQIMDQFAMAERTLGDLPLAELRALREQGRDRFAQYDVLSRRIAAVGKARVGAEKAGRLLAQIGSLTDRADSLPDEQAAPVRDRIKSVRDDLAFTLEDISYAVEDAKTLAGEEDSPVHQLDPDALFDAGDSVRQGETPDAALLDTVHDAAVAARDELLVRARASLDEIETVVNLVFPMPSGFDGFLYRMRILLGTDRQGRSILVRAVYSGKIAIQVGVVAAVVSVIVGTLLGASAAFFGGWVDHAVIWIYSTLSSIPYLVLLALLAFVFQSSDWTLPWDKSVKVSSTLIPLYAAFCMTFWIGTCRVIRGETLKLKELEYVQAATAIGFSRFYILLRHVVPNTVHLMFINFSLLLIAAIKSEVVLTFLGLGLKEGASWGIMINDSRQEVITGFFWQIGAATFFMLVLVLAFNIVSDALQDAFDPKHVG